MKRKITFKDPITAIVMISFLLLISACKKDGFLDPKTLSVLDETAIFSDSTYCLQYVNSRYNNASYSWEPTRFGKAGLECASDEAQSAIKPLDLQTLINGGGLNTSNAEKAIWNTSYTQIRAINIFLRNVKRMPVTTVTKNTWEGQLRFLRAWYYATLLKNFGGVPIVRDSVFSQDDIIDVPRNTYAETVDYVTGQCDESIQKLPLTYTNAIDYGRATQGSALGLKSRVLLYAASPLINTARGDDPNKLVSYGNADLNRWKKAADAAHAVVNLGQYSLFRRVTPFFYNTFLAGLTSANPNPEIIFAFYPTTSTTNNMYRETLANPASRGTRFQTVLTDISLFPLQELVDAFGMQNGKAITDPTSGYPGQGNNMYLQRDPRFYATITYNGALRFLSGKSTDQPIWTYTGIIPTSPTNDVAITGASVDGLYTSSGTKTGYFSYKMLANNVANGGSELNRPRILIRYAEILLNAAESLNEFSGPTTQVYDYVKMIRDRAGITPGTDGMYGMRTGLSQADMRAFLQNERQVELAFEEHRFWDVRRWKIAPAVLNKEMHGMEITRAADGSFSYRTIVVRKDVFSDKMYFFPIPQTEITKSPKLIQNPGF